MTDAGRHLAAAYGLDGRAAVVAGGSGLIGSAVCRELAALGANVAVCFRQNEARANEVVEEIRGAGGTATAIAADITEPDGARLLTDAVLDTYGRLDILVASAGARNRGLAMATAPADFRNLVAVNVEGVLNLARACLRSMLHARWGRIVLLGSHAGTAGLPGQAAYAATKAALSAWASSVAGEVGDRGITANVVAPGAIENPNDPFYSAQENEAVKERIGNRRLAQPDDIAPVVSFLCAAAAGYVNGATWAVDGGARF